MICNHSYGPLAQNPPSHLTISSYDCGRLICAQNVRHLISSLKNSTLLESVTGVSSTFKKVYHSRVYAVRRILFFLLNNSPFQRQKKKQKAHEPSLARYSLQHHIGDTPIKAGLHYIFNRCLSLSLKLSTSPASPFKTNCTSNWPCLVPKNFQDSLSHRIFGHINGALNIVLKNN